MKEQIVLFDKDNGGTISLTQNECHDSVTLVSGDDEIIIPAGDMVMLANHYRNCIEKGTPIVLDEYNNDYHRWLKDEVSFRLYEATDVWLDGDEATAISDAVFADLYNANDDLLDGTIIDSAIYLNVARHKKASVEAKFLNWLMQNGYECGCADYQVGSLVYEEKSGIWTAFANVTTSSEVVEGFNLFDSCDGFEVVPATKQQ